VRTGDFLLTVDGRPVTADENVLVHFDGKAGRTVELGVAAAPDGEVRTVEVVPIGDDFRLRHRAWIEANRARVEELSNGRLAYVYLPNTGGAGLAAFDRDFYSQLDRDGIVIDERYNGGGQVADVIVEVLARKTLCYWRTRERWLGRTPFAAMPGPKVMVINERAGSGGDALPWLFRRLGLGPLVGTRTWGGLVGISGNPGFVDGGYMAVPNFGIQDTDGSWIIENVGVAPDVEVIQWPKEVAAGRDPQLEKAVEIALAALAKTPPTPEPEYRSPEKR
jgi:tricorn protease